ncbi:MAG TPA: TonB family protein [Caulobacteraceae bacterium]|nr:TonB family protein [Caulobacteraceae bacterium]
MNMNWRCTRLATAIFVASIATGATAKTRLVVMYVGDAAVSDQMLSHYPAPARAAGVEGEAALQCARQEHGAPRDCMLVSEEPAGYDFGAAALGLAALAHENPKIADRATGYLLTFSFKLDPASITPLVLGMPHEYGGPDWTHKPSSDDINRAFPRRSLGSGLSTQVVLQCTVTAAGLLTGCVAHVPPGQSDFEASAMRLVPLFKMNPPTMDGEPTGGATVNIPIRFNDPNPR